MRVRPEKKKILFLTGTRADFGKLKPLIQKVKASGDLEYAVFATGMHMLARYGSTVKEIYKAGFTKVFTYINQDASATAGMDQILASTIQGLGYYVREHQPDLIVVHGDRVEALAGAIVGALNNVLVAHIEGGERSGTVDELIRHAVTKLAQVHFVANDEARRRLIQMGEDPDAVFEIGSPDVDVMLSGTLPPLAEVRKKYAIDFERYGIFTYHPVTTEQTELPRNIDAVLEGVLESPLSWVMIYPNNDAGSDVILRALERVRQHPRVRLIPSMRFEYYLTLMRHAAVVCGNSSAGVREAPVYGVPTVNIGTRQNARYEYRSIVNVPEDPGAIAAALSSLPQRVEPSTHFGTGNSAALFLDRLRDPFLWTTPRQKLFRDIATPTSVLPASTKQRRAKRAAA
jgi:UDP-N-acetylglucosamine 2-epimerase (hydrolysing)